MNKLKLLIKLNQLDDELWRVGGIAAVLHAELYAQKLWFSSLQNRIDWIEDCVSETMLYIVEQKPDIKDIDKYARRGVSLYFHKMTVRRKTDKLAGVEGSPELTQEIERILNELGPLHTLLYMLLYVEDLTEAQAAEALETSTAEVEQLKDELHDYVRARIA